MYRVMAWLYNIKKRLLVMQITSTVHMTLNSRVSDTYIPNDVLNYDRKYVAKSWKQKSPISNDHFPLTL